MKTGNVPRLTMTTIYEEGGNPLRYRVTDDPFSSRDERRKRHECSNERRTHGLSKRERRTLRKQIRNNS
jgi:hypothetical protein